MTIIICHNKLPDRNGDGQLLEWTEWVDDVMLGRDVLRILRFWKHILVVVRPLKSAARFFESDQSRIVRSLPAEILTITRYATRWGWGQHCQVSIGFYDMCPTPQVEGLKLEINKLFRTACICICTNNIIIIDVYSLTSKQHYESKPDLLRLKSSNRALRHVRVLVYLSGNRRSWILSNLLILQEKKYNFFNWLVGWLLACFDLRHINPFRVI